MDDRELNKRLRTYMNRCKGPVPRRRLEKHGDVFFFSSNIVENGLVNDIILIEMEHHHLNQPGEYKEHHFDKYKGRAVEELLESEEFGKYIFSETQRCVRQREEWFLQLEKDSMLRNMLGAYICTCMEPVTVNGRVIDFSTVFEECFRVENGLLRNGLDVDNSLFSLFKYEGQAVEELLKSEEFKRNISGEISKAERQRQEKREQEEAILQAQKDSMLKKMLDTYMSACTDFAVSDFSCFEVEKGLLRSRLKIDTALQKYEGHAIEDLLKSEEFKRDVFDEIQKLAREQEEKNLQEKKDSMLKNMLGAYILPYIKPVTVNGRTIDFSTTFEECFRVENGLLKIRLDVDNSLFKLFKYEGRAVEELLKSEEFTRDIFTPEKE